MTFYGETGEISRVHGKRALVCLPKAPSGKVKHYSKDEDEVRKVEGLTFRRDSLRIVKDSPELVQSKYYLAVYIKNKRTPVIFHKVIAQPHVSISMSISYPPHIPQTQN